MKLKLFQTTCKLSEADKLNDALTRNEWQNKKKKRISLSLLQKLYEPDCNNWW